MNLTVLQIKRLKISGVILLIAFMVALAWSAYAYSLPRTITTNISTDELVKQTLKEVAPTHDVQSDNSISVCIVGDMNLASDVGKYILDGLDPFQFMQEKFKTCDLLVGNLETNISTPGIGRPAPGKSYTFNGPVKGIDYLVGAGFDIVSLANNHTVDYGRPALADQLKLLATAGIMQVGAGNNVAEAFAPKYIVLGDTKIAFVAFNDIENGYTNALTNAPGSAYFDQAMVTSSIKTAQENADLVIAFPHWGVEHQRQPNSRQISWGQIFINAGADLVVGAHPHVRQTVAEYKGKKIHYSLGNFVFSGMGFNPEAIKGSFLTLTIKDKQIVDQKVEMVDIVYHGFPKWPWQEY